MLPAVLVLLDSAQGRWPLNWRGTLAYLRTAGPALAAVVLACGGYLAARVAVVGSQPPVVPYAAAEVLADRGQHLLTALQAWPEYARLLLFPRTLLIDYGPRVIQPATAWTGTAALGLLILTGSICAGVIALGRGMRNVALALLWFPVTILPVSNLPFTIGVLVAERTLYLPSIALSIALASTLSVVASQHIWWATRAAWAGVGVVLVAFSARTFLRVPEWASTERIFQALVRDRPDSYRGHWYLGRVARAQGATERAAYHFQTALDLWPNGEGLVLETATFALDQNRLADAYRLADFAAERWPGNAFAHRLRAATALDLGDTATARAAAKAGLQVAPNDSVLIRMWEEVFAQRPAGEVE
jgi:tetratricopeptide (TPR) repeat protein